ncbi:hypothetical protein SLA2020_132330 [Shorea laevis]
MASNQQIHQQIPFAEIDLNVNCTYLETNCYENDLVIQTVQGTQPPVLNIHVPTPTSISSLLDLNNVEPQSDLNLVNLVGVRRTSRARYWVGEYWRIFRDFLKQLQGKIMK